MEENWSSVYSHFTNFLRQKKVFCMWSKCGYCVCGAELVSCLYSLKIKGIVLYNVKFTYLVLFWLQYRLWIKIYMFLEIWFSIFYLLCFTVVCLSVYVIPNNALRSNKGLCWDLNINKRCSFKNHWTSWSDPDSYYFIFALPSKHLNKFSWELSCNSSYTPSPTKQQPKTKTQTKIWNDCTTLEREKRKETAQTELFPKFMYKPHNSLL